jgi:hypothetical protein
MTRSFLRRRTKYRFGHADGSQMILMLAINHSDLDLAVLAFPDGVPTRFAQLSPRFVPMVRPVGAG